MLEITLRVLRKKLLAFLTAQVNPAAFILDKDIRINRFIGKDGTKLVERQRDSLGKCRCRPPQQKDNKERPNFIDMSCHLFASLRRVLILALKRVRTILPCVQP
jgi:hypothetical protein